MRPRIPRSSSPAPTEGAALGKAPRTGEITPGAPSQSHRNRDKDHQEAFWGVCPQCSKEPYPSLEGSGTWIYTIIGNLHAGGASFMPVLLEILKPLKFRNN